MDVKQQSPLRVISERTIRLLSTAPFVYARTMADCPHSYTTRDMWLSNREFMNLHGFTGVDDTYQAFSELMGECITQNGDKRKFKDPRDPTGRGWYNRYFDMNGFMHWVMWPTPEETILMNRAPKPYPLKTVSGQEWDNRFSPHREMMETYYRNAGASGRILDIGCATGGLVDYMYQEINPDWYVGLDTSWEMLGWFALKHPEYRNRLMRTSFDDYETNSRFDKIVAMFGAADEVRQVDLEEKVRSLLVIGGSAYLMYAGSSIEEWRVVTFRK